MHNRSLLAFAGAVSLLLAGCASSGTDSKAGGDSSCSDGVTPIKALVAPGQAGAEIVFGNTLGYFKDACLDVSVQTAQSPAASLAAVTGGSADVTFTPVNVLVNATAKGLKLKALAPDSSIPPDAENMPYDKVTTSEFYVAPGTTVGKATDLEGKVVSVAARGDSSEMRLAATIVDEGGDPSKVKWTPLDFPTALQQLMDGKVYAAALVEPFATGAKEKGATAPVHTILHLYKAGAPYTMWTTSGALYDSKKEAMKRFSTAIMKVQQYAMTHKDAWDKAQSEYSKVPLETIQAVSEVPYWPKGLAQEDLTRVADIMLKADYLKKMPDLSDVIVK
ncbi:ABC transporter substrate-binding protein [Specibacter cremeus]|uniref:ABC transporter substrate-binding protein n=1 Tax=Specibacter cremeus TaxID=1629051 RepID=UPI0013DDAE3A|nr:ABC transporter substrate-binding protein [Specibacter cremeus]